MRVNVYDTCKSSVSLLVSISSVVTLTTPGKGRLLYFICVHHVFIMYSSRVHHVFMFMCSPPVHHVFITCSSRVHHVFITCSSRVHHVFITRSSRVHNLFTRVHHVFITCSSCVHHVFTTCSSCFALQSLAAQQVLIVDIDMEKYTVSLSETQVPKGIREEER